MLTDAGSTPARSTNFTLYMRLTKYQKARLLEYEWAVIDDDQDNTCWIQIDKKDGRVFKDISRLLKCSDDTETIKVLIVAHSECTKDV